jgi:ABC-2 type transport system ATP-binding protein
MEAIRTSRLSKIYPSGRKAVDEIELAIAEGQIFGFLGPNGAGKTTTVKLLSGMLQPTEGCSSIYGIDPAANPEQVHAMSGVVTEHAQMYDPLTGIQNLIFYGTVFGLSSKESEQRALKLLDTLSLTDAKNQKLAAYSTGMRQRLSLARALIHQPKVLFLDEPTSGLDPESGHSVNELIKALARDKGTTVFLCTHQLRYAQEICTDYGLIDEGRLLATGSLEALRAQISSGMTVTIKADRTPDSLKFRRAEDGSCEIGVQSEAEIPAIVKKIVDSGGAVYHVSARRPTLEEIYFTLIERRKEGGNSK